MRQVRCPACGLQGETTSRFCGGCGGRLPTLAPGTAPSAPGQPSVVAPVAQVTDVLPVVRGGTANAAAGGAVNAGVEPTLPPKRHVTAPAVVQPSQEQSIAMSRASATAPRRNLFILALLVFDAALAISGSVLWHKSRQRAVAAPSATTGTPANVTLPVDGNPQTLTPAAADGQSGGAARANVGAAAPVRPSSAPMLPVGSAASTTDPVGNSNGSSASPTVAGSAVAGSPPASNAVPGADRGGAGQTRPSNGSPSTDTAGRPATPPGNGSASLPSAAGVPREGAVDGGGTATSPPPPQPSGADSDPFLDAELVQAVLADDVARQTARSNAAFDRCYRAATKALPAEQPLQGSVTIAFTVQPSGGVADVVVSANSTESEQLASCVGREVSKWRFAPFTGEAAGFMRTIRFDGR